MHLLRSNYGPHLAGGRHGGQDPAAGHGRSRAGVLRPSLVDDCDVDVDDILQQVKRDVMVIQHTDKSEFGVGDEAEVFDAPTQRWIRCRIAGFGDRPLTYHIGVHHFDQALCPQLTTTNVPHRDLRRAAAEELDPTLSNPSDGESPAKEGAPRRSKGTVRGRLVFGGGSAQVLGRGSPDGELTPQPPSCGAPMESFHIRTEHRRVIEQKPVVHRCPLTDVSAAVSAAVNVPGVFCEEQE